MRLVDTHCHLDLYPDYQAVIAESDRLEIEVIAVTNTPSVFRQCVALTRGWSRIHPAVGLHPQLAAQRHGELSLLGDLLAETRFVGEIGLDFVTQDAADRQIQRRVFTTILEQCAPYGDKVLTIHSRRAAAEVVEMIGPSYPGTIILHWFSGSPRVLRAAIRLGHYFSVNPAMLTSQAGRRLISAMPHDRILSETDGPFVTVGGRAARPAQVHDVVAGLATLWDIEPSDVAARLDENYGRIIQGA